MEQPKKVKKNSDQKKKVTEPVPDPEPIIDSESDYDEDDLSNELNEAGEDFEDSELLEFPEFDLAELYAKYFEFEGQSMAEIAAGIRESIDANSKCQLKLAKEIKALAELIAHKK
jgi:hypothetical protein